MIKLPHYLLPYPRNFLTFNDVHYLIMRWITKYIRIPILVVLLFGTAQPSPNFFACTIRSHDLAKTRSYEHDCCKDDKPCAWQRNDYSKESIKAKPYLPCCESVVPYSSISEHWCSRVPNIILFISYLPNFDSSVGVLRITDWECTPPPKTLGIEILDLNLRI